MSPTNINDPACVSALLEQLKASAEWQELTDEMANSSASSKSAINPPPNDTASLGDDSISVSALLSQLTPLSVNAGASSSSVQSHVVPENKRSLVDEGNRRNLSFPAALPIISQLAEDKSFISAVRKIKEEQDTLERNLWSEREAIYKKYEDKLSRAHTKAHVIGSPVSQHEIDMMTDAFKKEIKVFDREQVHPAWDGLVSRQQQELEQLKVPTMYHTRVIQDRERQDQVIRVLETIVTSKPSFKF